MIDVIEKFLDEYGIKNSENTFLVGFSGGYDSMCLLDILNEFSNKYSFKLVAMHLNHNWRGEESRQESKNCEDFCKKRDIEYISETLELTGQKTENFARESRYNFFLKCAKQYKNSSIFTAHTFSDNAETVIYRIIKGTGIKGLQGIPPVRELDGVLIYRPLLLISRKQTEDYCNSKGLVPNNDSSNYDVSYKRNFIRHKIMPLLSEINFNAERAINSLSTLATSQSNIVNEYVKTVLKDIYIDEKLDTQKFVMLSEDVKKQIIYNACLKYNLDYDYKKVSNLLEFIRENANSKAGSRYSLTNDLWVYANSKHIYVIDNPKGEELKDEVLIDSEGEWDFFVGKSFSIEKYEGDDNPKFPSENADYAYVNLSAIPLVFTLRTRRDGDYIIPFGMNGKMKLKKYLNSKGISQHEKSQLAMLCQGSEVLWICGVGLSNKLKVVNRPTHVLRFKNKI